MAEGVCRLLRADVAVAVTGAGGPDPQDGQPPGTVWLALHHGTTVQTQRVHFSGEPSRVVEQTCARARQMLADHLERVCGQG
jgi:nicotinamide-nucleotide amidase